MRFILSLLFASTLFCTKLSAQKNTLEDLEYTKKDPKEELDYEENILKHGFFLDGLFQYTSVRLTDKNYNFASTANGFGLGFRLGNKWYFGNMKVYRPGISAVWGRINVLLVTPPGQTSIYPFVALAPANIGFANAFSFGGSLGLELNVNFGFNFILDVQSFQPVLGYLVNPTLKFRYKSFAVGLDVTFMLGDYTNYNNRISSTLIGLTVGGKF